MILSSLSSNEKHTKAYTWKGIKVTSDFKDVYPPAGFEEGTESHLTLNVRCQKPSPL